MSQLVHRRTARLALAALGASLVFPLAIAQPAQAAEPHQDNPYVGATVYVNPSWRASVEAEAAKTTDAALATKMRAVANTPTAVWMDRIAAISGADGGLGLVAHLDQALLQKQAGVPLVFQVVIYDLPGRDCAALASNGELPATAEGLARYKAEYIDVIAGILAQPKYADLRIMATIEPDSLPNLVTNMSIAACSAAAPYYRQGTTYALNKLHAISNVYNYLDIAHSGWLGWPTNSSGAATEFANVAKSTTAGFASVDGFISSVANYTPIREPNMTATQNVPANGGQPVMSSNFYEYNPDIDEASFTTDMYTRLVGTGFPASTGMIVDTSRGGWGGAARPAGPSASTDLNTFVNASKVDRRTHRGAWCNVSGAGIGERPQATPAGYASSHLDAFVWIKPPGESDGNSQEIPNDQGKRFDRMCDPTFSSDKLKGNLTGALPNAPLAGQWFPEQFTMLVQNAYPSIGSNPGGDTIAPTAPAGVTVTSTTSSSVALSWTASTDAVGVTGYDIYRGTTLAGTSATTSFTATGLAGSTAYSFTVRARDAAGNVSAASSAVTATTQPGTGGGDTIAPTVPTGVTVTGTTSSSASLSWTASTDTVGVTGYDIYRGSTLAGSSTTTTFTATGLTAETAYSFTVRAKDAAGNISAPSTAVSATTAPGGGGTGTVKVQYKSNDTAASDNQIKPGLQIVNTGTTTLDLSTVKVRYYFTKDTAAALTWACDYAVIGCGNVRGTFSAVSPATATADSYLELAFTGSLAPGASTGEVQNRINHSDWSNFTEIDDYSRGTNTTFADATTVTAHIGTTLAWGTPPGGGGGGGDTTAPTAPTALTAAGTTSSSVSLSWTASTDAVGVTGYDVYRGTTLAGSSTTTSFTDTGRTASTAYSYTVRAKDAAGNVSAASTAVSATTQPVSTDTTAPTIPTGLTATAASSSSIALTWNASTDAVGVTGYDVYRGTTRVATATTTSFTDTGLTASTAYTYTVRAKDAAGNVSAAPTAASATTLAGTGGGTPLAINGQLRVCGVYLCNQYNQPVQLRGMSSHGLQWFGACYNAATLDVLANEWKSDLFRIAMYVQEGGYETNPTAFTNQVNSLVDLATARGMYALIDFHTLTPGDPNYNLERAKTFFATVAARNADNPGVIYEIANEPNGVSWTDIKRYADAVIPVIRANDPDAVIIVGTMGWSSLGVSGGGTYQDIVSNKIADPNVMYAFHFYAASHGDNYRQTVASASAVLPLFVTEFGTVTYTGGGAFDQASSTAWLDLLDSKKIGYANWTYSDANESSAAFTPGNCGKSGTSVLTPSGAFMRSRIVTPDNFPTGGGGGGGDTTAPTVPTGLTVTGTTASSVSLSWTASTDAVGVTGYQVYRGTTLVATAAGTSYTDAGLSASTAYSYTVRARDAAGNVSAVSAAVTGTTSPGGGGGGTGAVKVQYKINDTNATDNQIKPGLQIVNTGSASVNLSTVTARYYFTRDGGASTFNAWCDWAQVGCANVSLKVVNLTSAVAGADAYLEVSFTGGSMAAGASTGELQLRLNKSDWTAFNEVGDYSRGANTAFADATKVPAYVGGTLAWGSPPA